MHSYSLVKINTDNEQLYLGYNNAVLVFFMQMLMNVSLARVTVMPIA